MVNKKNIIKDIAILIFVWMFVYFVFNNTYVRPLLPKEDLSFIKNKTWSINKKEHKIVIGLTGHTYLEMVDINGEVIGQIHGFAYDTDKGEVIERAMKIGYKLKVFVFDYNYYSLRGEKENNSGISLYNGTASTTIDLWGKAKICAAAIDNRDYNYPQYGFNFMSETENSNSVAHSIINCIGLIDKNIGLITPGRSTELIR